MRSASLRDLEQECRYAKVSYNDYYECQPVQHV